ncbi:MAG: hypothetical protein ACT4QA_01895 [Panacagrimonas sp.]
MSTETRSTDVELTREERLALSYLIFTDPDFRERLLTDPTTVAAERGIKLPAEEHAELLHHQDGLRAYGQAIDNLVSIGKDRRTLWQDPNLGVCAVNHIASPGDWDPHYPHPKPRSVGNPGIRLVRRNPSAYRRRTRLAPRVAKA